MKAQQPVEMSFSSHYQYSSRCSSNPRTGNATQDPRRGKDYFRAPGPLTISAVALFGNQSFFGESRRVAALNSTAATTTFCESSRIPLAANTDASFISYVYPWRCDSLREGYVADDAPDWNVARVTLDWFAVFNSSDAAPKAFEYAMFYATDALMEQASRHKWIRYLRLIYASDGRMTQKPLVSLPSLILLSVLLAIEVVLLLRIAYYAWSTPAWTSTLKSLSVAQLANAMNEDTLPPTGCSDKESLKVLSRMDGRIGVGVMGEREIRQEVRRLVHGGREPILQPSFGRPTKKAFLPMLRRTRTRRRSSASESSEAG